MRRAGCSSPLSSGSRFCCEGFRDCEGPLGRQGRGGWEREDKNLSSLQAPRKTGWRMFSIPLFSLPQILERPVPPSWRSASRLYLPITRGPCTATARYQYHCWKFFPISPCGDAGDLSVLLVASAGRKGKVTVTMITLTQVLLPLHNGSSFSRGLPGGADGNSPPLPRNGLHSPLLGELATLGLNPRMQERNIINPGGDI